MFNYVLVSCFSLIIFLRKITFPLPRFELAQRRAAKAGHIDAVDTQPFEATLAAERFEQESPEVTSNQVAPREEQSNQVCRSLARDFSSASPDKPDDNPGLALGNVCLCDASLCSKHWERIGALKLITWMKWLKFICTFRLQEFCTLGRKVSRNYQHIAVPSIAWLRSSSGELGHFSHSFASPPRSINPRRFG